MFERQFLHYLLLAGLLAGVGLAVALDPGMLVGEFIGLTTGAWLTLAILVPIVHQGYVWFVWRAELHHRLISRWLGAGQGFALYAIGFMILLPGRVVTLVLLALSNRGTLGIDPVVAYVLAALLAVPMLYLMHSVVRYFGLRRALGADHFSAAYRHMPLVRRGIYRYTSNGMYLFGFLVLWIVALLFRSQAALLAAAFNHTYIWVHHYCTELPDM